MKKILLALFILHLSSFIYAQQTKPGLRWWWLGSAVTPQGLTWNMEQMASHGIGTLEITPLYGVQGNDKNNIKFLSPRWMDMLGYCISEGKRLGVEIDMNLGTGWPFGGPTTPITEAACKLVVVDTIVPSSFSGILPPPEKEEKYAKLLVQKVFPKTSETSRVIALYESRTRQKVKRAAPGGEGWVIDHYDSTAVAHYLQKFDKAFGESKVAFPAVFFNDSYEVYKADWTPTLLREFKTRRGYALEDSLEQFVDGNPHVISDYRETLSDLLLKNFTEQWVSWSHKHGVLVRNQAHGSPANLIDVYSAVDIPEIEGFGLSDFGIKGLRKDPGFTKKNFADYSMLKYASSAAHINGKKLTSSETFSWLTEHFRTSLSQMKPDMDLMFCSGVNRMFFHGASYSPKDDPWPGWRFYASVDMSPTNTIWRDAPEFTKYIDFCQTRLQAGQPDNDFLVLLPIRNMWRTNTNTRYMMFDIHHMGEKAPEFIQTILKIDSLGYDCDYISERYLLTTDYINGRLQTAAGTRYSALIIPGENTIMTDRVKQHIAELQSKGAIIIYKVEREELIKAAKPEAIRADLHLKMIRRQLDSKYQYFVSNLTPDDVCQDVVLASTGKTANIDLHSGESVFIYSSGDGQPTYEYPLAHTSQTITEVADLKDNKWTLCFTECQPKIKGTFKLNGLTPWENGIATAPAAVNDSIKTLMGTGVYETTFQGPGARFQVPGARYSIDLGDVRESARVYINNTYIGTAWCVPYTLNIPDGVVRNGNNTLRIEVTNLPANRIADYDRKGIKWRKFNEINVVDLYYKHTTYEGWAPVPSGLNSTVKIYKQSLWPNGTTMNAWFMDTKKVDVNTLGKQYVITDYGVKNDSTLIQTKEIQSVIDKAAQEGGGVIVIPQGTFMSGSLFFKQGTHLYVKGKLKGSDRIRDYRLGPSRMEGLTLNYFSALINADGLDGFCIIGDPTTHESFPPEGERVSEYGFTADHSCLDGNGYNYWEEFWYRRLFNPKCTNLEAMRPRLVFMSNCKNVTVQDMHLCNSGFWTNHIYRCDHVRYLDDFIYAQTKGVIPPGDTKEHGGPSTDALDIDFCHDVLVDNCFMQVNDDAVVIKGGKGTWADKDPNNGPVYNVLVQNCHYGVVHGCLTVGSESVHDWNIILRNISFRDADRVIWLKMRPDTPQHYEKITVENMQGTCTEFLVVRPWKQFFKMEDRKDMPLSECNDITFKDIKVVSRNFFDVGTSDKYKLDHFNFINCDVQDEKKAFDPELIEGSIVKNVNIR